MAGESPKKLEVGEEAGESMSEDSRSDGMAREDSDVAELGGAASLYIMCQHAASSYKCNSTTLQPDYWRQHLLEWEGKMGKKRLT